ncbi:MAG: hypothetical protein GY810_02605 [Aureispira sp.]|nr:hypothetical protein [Aureispira sp.]
MMNLNPKIEQLLESNTSSNNYLALQLLQTDQGLSLEDSLKTIILYRLKNWDEERDYFDLSINNICLSYEIDNYSNPSNNPKRDGVAYLERGIFDIAQNIEDGTDDIDYVRVFKDHNFNYYRTDFSIVRNYKDAIIKDLEEAISLLAKLLSKEI